MIEWLIFEQVEDDMFRLYSQTSKQLFYLL